VERTVVGVGVLHPDEVDVVLDLGHGHPSAHGGLRVALSVDGGVVVAAEPLVGHLHRGAEKLFEVRDYRSAVMLADRHDWLSAFANELGVVLAAERLLGMEVPPRATWLRTALAELNRLTAGLAFLGSFPTTHGDLEPLRVAHRARERLLRVLEEATGARMHVAANRVGGLHQDVPAGWSRRVFAALADVRADLDRLGEALADERLVRRTTGVGVLDAATAAAHGVTGVVARASGLDVDLRRDDPVLAYPDLEVPVVTRSAGDALARFQVLHAQLAVAAALVEECLERAPDGDVALPLPKSLKVPVGETYAWVENPLGAMGYYLVSKGQKTPWRLAMRTPSFATVSAVPALLPGTRVEDVAAVLASLFFVIGDVDR
jgi:NADH-quinone oxidoreductase subunit D